jgi:hypothetical protein
MVRDLGRQIEDTVRDIGDNVDRIHFLRRKVDDRIHDNKKIDPQDIGELVQREVVTAHAAYQISEVTRESDPEKSIAYRRMTAQLLGRAGGDLLSVGQVGQAERYFEDAARMSEEIGEEIREFQRREPSRKGGQRERYNARGSYLNRRVVGRDRKDEAEERGIESRGKYISTVVMIISGIIVLFLMGMPGITGAVVGGVARNWLSVAGILIVLCGACWIVFEETRK